MYKLILIILTLGSGYDGDQITTSQTVVLSGIKSKTMCEKTFIKIKSDMIVNASSKRELHRRGQMITIANRLRFTHTCILWTKK